MRSRKTHHTLIIAVWLVVLCLILGGSAWADTLETVERRITASTAYETTPTLGNDGTTDLVVFTVKPVVGGVLLAADVWYQPLADGAPNGMPVQVTSGPTDDQLNDVSGDFIVFTAYESVSSSRGAIVLHQISTGVMHTLGSAVIIQEPRIHGGTVVWSEGGAFATMVMRYKLDWIGTGIEADILAGPVPPTFDIQIGDRFAVWSEFEGGQYDIFAYDLDAEIERRITSTPAINENAPATSGAWIVWQAANSLLLYYDHGFIYDGTTYTTLGVPGAASRTYAYGINDAGTVVGLYFDATSQDRHGFIYDDTTYTTLDVPGAADTEAHDINRTGTVVGEYHGGPAPWYHGFIYDGTTYTTLDVPGGYETHARGINDAGTIVGYYMGGGEQHSFIYDGTTYTILDVPGASGTYAHDINNAGIIVGSCWNASGDWHGFIYDGTTYTILDVPGGYETHARGINDAGTIVGYYMGGGEQHSFIYDGTTYTILDVPGASGTYAHDINNAGTVVGGYSEPPESTIQAYNQDTHASRTIVDDGAGNFNPSMDGDLVAWESDVSGNLDIWLYRMSTGETFQVTTEEHDQYLNDVFADMVAYVDLRRGTEDVYVSRLQFIPDNQPPLANAGADQTVHAGSLVTLDGTGSTDPDKNLPLTYAWTIVSLPAGSGASLSDPTSATASFVADRYGEYLLTLTVTDSLGLSSTADYVLISTSNSAPFADAGADQAVVLVGTTVHLDGNGSYDPDGDPITYQWNFISRPVGSTATLDGATTATPSFLADKYGRYEIQLVVADPWASSADEVVVSFDNVAPVADAGTSGTAVVGETVTLDGRASRDANGDALTYQWGFTSLPAGSTAAIFDPTAAVTTFVPDLPGLYVVQLVVSDGMLDSEPSTIQVQVISQQSVAVNAINAIIESVGSLDPGDLKNANMQNALINKLNAVIASIEAGRYADALDKLQNDILKKTDGCAIGGESDKNDWIKNCEAQAEVYPFIIAAIATISGL